MNRTQNRKILASLPVLVFLAAAAGAYDLSQTSVQYVVATSHLDTQWEWTILTTINDYLPATLRDNFALFRAYPSYKFTFEGAYRYMLAKRYYPAEYDTLKKFAASGNWVVGGSMVDACDVNLPSPESLVRQILYGNGFFQDEFGTRSLDVFLPDCFGFGAALPTVAAHCGLRGFSTQKLTSWRGGTYSSGDNVIVGIPFDIGVWKGVDGDSLVAAINPGSYISGWDVRRDQINSLGASSGVHAAYDYFGVGDQGGANDPSDVASLTARIRQNDTASIKVINTGSDQFFRDLTPAQISRLPHYQGELLVTQAAGGFYTSQAKMKWYNRKNELRADAAERASVIASWLGEGAYPAAKLKTAWIRFLWHQFHDDLTGTGIPEVYVISRRDEDSSLTEFSQALSTAAAALARNLDTRVTGVPVAVYNPLSIDRQDIAQVKIHFTPPQPSFVRVYDAAGIEVPGQIVKSEADSLTIAFVASVPSVGVAVYDVRGAAAAGSLQTGLSVHGDTLESNRYRVILDVNGDMRSVFDKSLGQELLSSPARLELLADTSNDSPAWDILWSTNNRSPAEYVAGPVVKEIVESGPARVTLRTTRTQGGSTYSQDISLSAQGAGNRVELSNVIQWNTHNRLLKASFPFTMSNSKTTYDLGLGTVQRGTNSSRMHEVPAHQWADITGSGGGSGAAVLNDCKYGWDKPAANEIRLTLLHSPTGTRDGQNEQEIGQTHEIRWAVCGHAGDWRQGNIVAEAAGFNQPLVAFQTDMHAGRLGKTFGFVRVSDGLQVMALKKAERSESFIVRVREITGARELNGQEDDKASVTTQDSAIVFDINGYQPKTFSFTLGAATSAIGGPGTELAFVKRPRIAGQSAGRLIVSIQCAGGHAVRLFSVSGALLDARFGNSPRTYVFDMRKYGRQTFVVRIRDGSGVVAKKISLQK